MLKINRKLIALLVMAMLVCSLTVAAFADGEEVEYVSSLATTIWALFPPVIAIVLALITKEVFSSLFIGIIAGGLMYANFNPVMAFDTVIESGFIATIADPWNAGIFMFLVLLGGMVALMNQSGGSAAFGRWAATHVKSRTGAMFATFALGILIFVDDYFNCLTVGSVMRPLSDAHKISRAKLAYIIDATAAPICMIAPVSSWAAAVGGFVPEDAMNSMELFIRAIPYNFYSLLTFVFVIGLIRMNFDFGPMRVQEMAAQLNGELGAVESAGDTVENPKSRVSDLVIPVVFLIACCIGGMVYNGVVYGGETILGSFSATDASVGLPWGATIAVVMTIIYLVARRILTFKGAMECLTKGFIAMVPAILILTFAISLKNMTGLLDAAGYVEMQMSAASAGLTSLLPAIIFIVACFLAFSTGTSWGTFGILIPIIVEAFPVGSELLIIGVSACLAGAVCGDHCSPISDTTIMSSAGAGCNHVTHVSTQLPYSLTVAAISFVCFILAGFIQNAYICLAIGAVLTVVALIVLKKIFGEAKA